MLVVSQKKSGKRKPTTTAETALTQLGLRVAGLRLSGTDHRI